VPIHRDPDQPPIEEVDRAHACDLDPVMAERIADLSSRIHKLDFYQVLGVRRDADKDTVKRAYYQLAPVFHPDKYYGKKIGEFRPAMEYIFSRITMAFDTLRSPSLRSRYDRMLAGLDAEPAPIAVSQEQGERPRKQSDPPEATTDPADREAAEAQFLVETADIALARGDFNKAARAYRMALEIADAPETREALARAEELGKVRRV